MKISPKILFLFLFLICFIFIGLAVIFYGSDFKFLSYPFSYSGATVTKDNLPNLISYYLFTAGMLLSGAVMLLISLYYANTQPKSFLKIIFTAGASLGFILTAFSPINLYHQMHVFASWLAIVSLWLIAVIYLFELKKRIKLINFVLLQIFLQIPMIIYAITFFFLINPFSFLMQKIAMFTLFLVLFLSAPKFEEESDLLK